LLAIDVCRRISGGLVDRWLTKGSWQEVAVGSTRERVGSSGSVRYTALYRDLKGRQRSAGTFTTERQADRAWQRAESRVAQGQLREPGRGRQTFRDYVEQTWLPNHEIEATTRQSYTYVLRRRIFTEFGPMRMIDILPEHVREWVAGLKAGGVKPPTIRSCFVVLSAVFTTALNDQVTFLHPCKGVRTPRSRLSRARSSRQSSSPPCMSACRTRCPSCSWRPPWRAACAGVS
jgi:hypothetical protein